MPAIAASANDPLAAKFLGSLTIPNNQTAVDSNNPAVNFLVGGLSGITYAGGTKYFSILDNQGTPTAFGVTSPQTARFYTLDLSVSLKGISLNGPIAATSMTAPGVILQNGSWDGEGIAVAPGGTSIFVASENDPDNPTPNAAPTIRQFNVASGAQIGTAATVPIPNSFVRDASSSQGIRGNLALESLTMSQDGLTLYTANEESLFQDGGVSTSTKGSTVRILKYTRPNLDAAFVLQNEYAYITNPIPDPNAPAGSDSGLVDMTVLPSGALLTLERSFVRGNPAGQGNYISVFQTDLYTATPVAPSATNLPSGYITATKRELIRLTPQTLGFSPDNIEGMGLGPVLADGSYSLLLTSDNNFGATQTTQIVALSLFATSQPHPIP